MRYSVSEARITIEQFRRYSIDDLDALFGAGALPMFNEFEGETVGEILVLNPKNPLWLMCVIKIVFKSPMRHWTGKKFLTSFDKGKNGYGINLFKNKFSHELFKFDTYIENAYADNKPCLALDYRCQVS